jgi:AcrR family transcriptional regulator
MNTKRLTIAERRESILKACIKLASKKGCNYKYITRQQIAERAGCSPTLVTHYFGNMRELQKALVEYALRIENANVVIQALLNREFNKTAFIARASIPLREKIRKGISF